MAEQLRQKVIKGVLWRFAEQIGTEGIGFVVGIVLARLLGPTEYGTIALLSIFIAVSNTLVDGGFASALIQKLDATDEDFNSIFYLSIFVSGVLYTMLFFAAPFIAAFYKIEVLVSVLRVMALSLFLTAINGVQNAVLARKMLFNLSFRISLSGTITHGIVGITLAIMGYGVWALVWASLSALIVSTCVRWFLIGWRPRLTFSMKAVRPLFNFSWKLMVVSLIDSFFINIYGLIIGRIYTPRDLALYNRGQSMPKMCMASVNSALGAVAFPALSKLQQDRAHMKEAMRKVIQVSSFFIMPMMAALAAVADPLVSFLYGDKWNGTIVFVQIACVSFSFWPFHTINLQGMKAIGRSDLMLKLEVIKKALSLISIFVVMNFGVVAFALVGAFAMTPLSVLINTWPNKRLLNYGFREQIIDAIPILVISVITFALVWPMTFFCHETSLTRIFLIVSQITVFCGLFYAQLRIFRPRAVGVLAKQIPFIAKLGLSGK